MTTDLAGPPHLQVRLFAGLREQAGWGERHLALHEPATPDAHNGAPPPTAAQLWQRLGLGPWPAGVRVAVNREFAEPGRILAAGDEVAYLPPITGG
ncbi:MoaD/ThiS family protein [Synechococcus sp. CS-1328]|uniref:MoaD/ThiS family protein n=1 Tax=Synechococcus sp. CS-1328 TaxID=2847976 RepID=UPI00223A9198|nr:MoaD/ThiS family protein [Synechococcus sp. CS-1328]MCT0224343.1 MoaD/ThiS family protein [Synechococcus sp. CS-1328]